jgi:hypothetical protein
VNAYNPKADFAHAPPPVTTMVDPNFTRSVETLQPIQVELTKERALEYFFPIINRPDCRVCHGYGGFVRGVAHFKLSIAGIFDQISSAANLLVGLFAAVGVAISGLLLLMPTARSSLRAGDRPRGLAVGDGDLTARQRTVARRAGRGGTLNAMIAAARANELALRNRVIDARNAETASTDTIQEGLLLVGRTS